MKYALLLITLTISLGAMGREYVVSETIFPSMIPIGSTVNLSDDHSELTLDTFNGDEMELDCLSAPPGVLENEKDKQPNLSSLLTCGNETIVILMDQYRVLNYNGIFSAIKKLEED